MKARHERIVFPGGQSFRLIRWEKNLREVVSLLADGKVEKIAGEGGEWHHHVEQELTLFTKGTGTRFVGDHIGGFGAGDLVLLGSNLPHFWNVGGECAGVSIQWHFPVAHPLRELPEMGGVVPELMKRAEKGMRIRGEAGEAIGRLMCGMVTEEPGVRLAKLLEIFSRIAKLEEREVEVLSTKAFGSPGGARYQQQIGEAVKHLIGNFREEIRMEDLLRLTAMSRPTFARRFKELAGRTASEFVNQLRIQAACRELAETEKSVLEIALGCGFGQISFFNRLFRREKGCSPREYRKRRR